jgi:hypothetical protein
VVVVWLGLLAAAVVMTSTLADRNWWLPRWLDRRLPHVGAVETAAADAELTRTPTLKGAAPPSAGTRP